MESGNGSASSKGFIVPVATSSDAFHHVLAPLKSSYLRQESESRFQYKSAVLIKNPGQEKRYEEFRAQRRDKAYSDEDLKECYGFLLFDDFNKALAFAETGVITGNSQCKILGDPQKGVYLSLYSDCLDVNPWYHGRSGCIVIFKLTKGRVKKVTENYSQKLAEPTQGFDCHMSEKFLTVSATTSSSLAFRRTQCYIYEQPDKVSKETIESPRGASPIAIVTFSYSDTKEAVAASLKESAQRVQACRYFPWRGKLQISVHSIDVGLRAKEGAWAPVQLPPVLKIDQAIALSDLGKLLPKTVFETYPSGEVYLEGLYCSAFELISSEIKQAKLLSLLILEIKERQLAPSVPLNDGGFLILLPSSLFHSYNGTRESVSEILHGLFVFPDSRLTQRDTKHQYQKVASSSEILRVLPALSYAEGKVEKTHIQPREDLCRLIVLHMQNYSALVHPGSAERPQEIKVLPEIDVHVQKHRYLSSECTFQAWENLKSYFKRPVLFQLPVSKATEILLDDKVAVAKEHDVSALPSSPEQTESDHVNLRTVEPVTGQKSAVQLDTTLDRSGGEAQSDLTDGAQSAAANNCCQVETETDAENTVLSRMIKTVSRSKRTPTASTSDLHHPAELIVSFTSAESAVAEESGINDELSHFSSDKVKAMDDQTVAPKKSSEDTKLKLSTANQSSELKGPAKGKKRGPRSCDETSSIQVNGDRWTNEESFGSGRTILNKLRNTPARKVQKNTLKKLLRNKDIKYFCAYRKEKRSNLGQKSCGTSMNFSHPQKKTERWDLKPVVSECGRILVPHGHCDSGRTKASKDKVQSTVAEASPPRRRLEDPVSAQETSELDLKPITAEKEAATAGTEATVHEDGERHSEKAVVKQVDLEHNLSTESGDEKDPLSLTSESSDHCTKNKCPLSPDKCVTKSDALLSKLKSVLLRGKRKATPPALEDNAATVGGTESGLKKSKVDAPSHVVENVNEVGCGQQPSAATREVPMRSVDPHFASALGLTPKQAPSDMCANEPVDSLQRNEPSDKEAEPDSDKHEVTANFHQFYPRRGRIKALKKHQSLSTELVKKNWWLHFQNLTSVDSANPGCSGPGDDHSDGKAATEKTNGASSSSDGLNLLADLALSTNSLEQVLPQQEQAVEGRQEMSLSREPESVLHALLRQPPARQIQLPERPLLNPVVGGADLVSLISKEHAYTFPQSSSMPLSLLVAPFQVSPLSGSTRLLHHQQTMNCEEIKTSHATVEQRSTKEPNQKDPELQKKHKVRGETFCRSRTFVNKDGSILVTKPWKENYDFNFDSKFTNDSKYRAICRALHGPWDSSFEDTSEEVRLIFHMWIGLFYSRSTPRTFDFDSNCSNAKECDPQSRLTSVGQALTQSLAPSLNVPGTSDASNVNALDLSKKDGVALDLGGDVLDLSQRNAQAKLDIEPHAKQRQTPWFAGQKESGHGTLIAFESTTVSQKSLEDTNTSKGTCAPSQKAGFAENPSSLELHDPLDGQQDYTQKTRGTDHVELTNNHGINNINEHTKVEFRTIELLNKRDKFVQELPEKTRVGQFEMIDLLEVKQDLVQKGNELLPQQRTKAEELEDVRDRENVEMVIKDDSMRSSSKRTQASASTHLVKKQRNEKIKPVQEGSSVPPSQSIHVGELQVLENRDKKEKMVIRARKEPSKRLKVDESQEQDVFEVKEKPAQMYCMKPSSVEICPVICKDGVNLEMREKTAQEDIEVRSPQNDNVGNFSDKEQSGKEKLSDKINDLEVNQEEDLGDSTSVKSDVCGENLSTVQPSGSKSKAVSQDENADYDCEEQKGSDLVAKKDGLDVKDAFTMDLEVGRDPSQLVSKTPDVDRVKKSYFSDAPCQTLVDQQTTTKDEGHCVSDLDSDVEVCSSLAHLRDDTVPQTSIKQCRVQIPLLELSPLVTQDQHTLRNLQFKLLRAKGSSLADQKASREKTPQTPNEMKSMTQNSAMENSKKEVTVSSAEEHNDKSTDRQEMLPAMNCSLTKNDTTVFQAEMGSSRKTDCDFNQAKEDLGKTYISPVNQLIGSYTPSKNMVQSHEVGSEGNMANTRSPIDALTCETTNLKTLLPLNTGSEPLDCQEISGLPSNLEVTEKAEAKVLDREGDTQCPTPTMDEEPFPACSDLSSSNDSSCATHPIGDKNCGKIYPVSPVRSSALVENGMPVRQQPHSGNGKDQDCLHHTNTDTGLKSQGVVQSTDKNRTVSKDGDLQLFSGNVDDKTDKRHEILDQNYASLEVYPNSQRPVMAVKPSKGDKIQGSCVSQQSLSEGHLKSNYFKGKSPIPASIPASVPASTPSDKNTREDMQESSTDATPSSWLSSAGVSMCATGTEFHQPLDPLHLQEKSEMSKSTKILSSQSSERDEDTLQKSQTARENTELENKSSSFASSASVGDGADGGLEYGFVMQPQNSLACTIFNTTNNRPESLLEKLSKRCIQADPTEASMEQECLIFSEQMKQLIKRARSGPIHQQEAHDQKHTFCPSPVTVRFSDLEEVDTKVGHLDESSFVLPKIKVDISDRKTLADTTGGGATLCPPEECDEPGAHPSVSGVTKECARLYMSMMNDVCGASRVPVSSNYYGVDKVLSRTQPSNHFDFCDQMKKEVDYNFCNSINSVVRKFCKTKYKFFILATSNDVFFEKTKVHLESEGHSAVQPSEFFLGDDGSTLIIVLRNEDIGEHVCQVPHLLMLKKSQGVRFAGIDEPDDVVNLTHQELFVKGGFVVFDRATLESLTHHDMKKMSELFKELSRTGKWKWMLHYRDSRRLRENARVSAEAEERKRFISWCQDVGMLEVLPYHECDPLSRDQADYLTCMIRLQVQNISSRYSVFVTDKTVDGSFGKNGILTFTLESFLTCCPSELFVA